LEDTYSIIIPIYNEDHSIQALLQSLKNYAVSGHEVIIVNDGSTDNSKNLLSKCDFIKIINLPINVGKGNALKQGLKSATNEKIIIFDGDMEISTSTLSDLMILDRSKNIHCVFGSRKKYISTFKSFWDLGNVILTTLFNFFHGVKLEDALCCVKAFCKSDLNISALKSSKFDIDVEIARQIVSLSTPIKTISVDYKRRSIKEGKKLKFFDAWLILKCILKRN